MWGDTSYPWLAEAPAPSFLIISERGFGACAIPRTTWYVHYSNENNFFTCIKLDYQASISKNNITYNHTCKCKRKGYILHTSYSFYQCYSNVHAIIIITTLNTVLSSNVSEAQHHIASAFLPSSLPDTNISTLVEVWRSILVVGRVDSLQKYNKYCKGI